MKNSAEFTKNMNCSHMKLFFRNANLYSGQYGYIGSSLLRIVGNMAKGPISKRVVQGKKCSFSGKFGVLCFLETPVLRFALLPYYRQNILYKIFAKFIRTRSSKHGSTSEERKQWILTAWRYQTGEKKIRTDFLLWPLQCIYLS